MDKEREEKIKKINCLRAQFKKETEIPWLNSLGVPDLDYVFWLENLILFKKEDKNDKPKKDYNCLICKDEKVLQGGLVEKFPCPKCTN